MMQEFYLIGATWDFYFPKDIVSKIMCSVSVYDVTLGKHGPINNRYRLNVTVSIKDSSSLKEAIKNDVDGRYNIKLKKNFKAILLGRKYELRLPDKEYKSFRELITAKGCKVEKVSLNEGDGNINVFVIIPSGKVAKIKNVIRAYAKKAGFNLVKT